MNETLLDTIKSKKVFVLDLDGVVYFGDTLAPGADTAISLLRENGYGVVFLTNASGKRHSSVCAKLGKMGIDCTEDGIYTSVDSALRYIKANALGKDGVYCVGSGELCALVEESGLQLAPPETCGCLLVGMKTDMTYEDATQAIIALRRGVPFIACNKDHCFPGPDGTLTPGCGYTVGAIEGSYPRKVDFLAGKPNPHVLEVVCDGCGTAKDELVLVGDLWNADIALAQAAGVPAVYVGTEDFPSETENVYKANSLYDFVVEMLEGQG